MPSTVLNQQVYQGTVYSSALAYPGGVSTIIAAGLMSTADGNNPANTLTVTIEVSYDGGNTFAGIVSANWQGGGGPFGLGGNPSGAPTHVRVRLDIPQSLSVGATLDFA